MHLRKQLALFSLLAASAPAQVLVNYDPVGTQGSAIPVNPTTMAPSVTASDLSQTGFMGSWGNTNVWPVGQLGAPNPTPDPLQYVTFEVSSSAVMNFTTLTYSRTSYTGEGNRQASVRTSADGFMTDVDVLTGLPTTGFVDMVFDVSSLAPTVGPIEFRIFLYDAPTTGLDWVDLISTQAGGTGLTLEGTALGIGSNYCAANPNSTGQLSSISGQGSAAAADNDVTLVAESLPNFVFGFFLTSQTQGFVATPNGSQGNLCVGGSIGRYVGPGQIKNSGNNGSFSLVIDLTLHPQPNGFVSVAPGETWNFQAWHRDAAMGSATSNFTDGLSIVFQ